MKYYELEHNYLNVVRWSTRGQKSVIRLLWKIPFLSVNTLFSLRFKPSSIMQLNDSWSHISIVKWDFLTIRKQLKLIWSKHQQKSLIHWFQEPITCDCVACCCYVLMLSYCLKVTLHIPQMINLDNITKHRHDTSSQLDKFCPVLKAEDDYAKYMVVLWINAYQLI